MRRRVVCVAPAGGWRASGHRKVCRDAVDRPRAVQAANTRFT
jgi:hypothetical protein